MTKTRTAIIAAVAVGALVWAIADRQAARPPATPATLTLSDQFGRASQDYVRASLRDPDSARFHGAPHVDDLGPWAGATVRIACGYVNAKNGFGGYAGEQPWYLVTFRDGSAGACLGKLEDCGYVLTRQIADAARACLQAVTD